MTEYEVALEEQLAGGELAVRVIARRRTLELVEVIIGVLCPRCGGPRGVVRRTQSVRRGALAYLSADVWHNPCGHVDKYPDVIAEAQRLKVATSMLAPVR
jgi:hypothetical protein